MALANILLIPMGDFLSLYGLWFIGAMMVAGLMVMLTIRLRVLGPGEE